MCNTKICTTLYTRFGKTSKISFASLKLYAILESWFTHISYNISIYPCTNNILFLEVILKNNPEVTVKKIQEPIQSYKVTACK